MELKISKGALTTFLVLAAAGFADALYLTVQHYTGGIAPCYIGSCEKVLSSSYSVVFGIPLAVLGLVYYAFMLFVLALYLQSRNAAALKLAVFISPVGFIASMYFVYLQKWMIQAWCQYCLFSAFTSTAMFLLALFVYQTSRTSTASDGAILQ